MRAVRLATVICLVSGALAACSLILDFDALLPLPPATDAAPIVDAREDVVEAGIVCQGGFANCDEDAAVCETFIGGSDDKNCGACRRSCGGTACKLGYCEPIVVARSEGNPLGIATDGQWVYWANSLPGDAGAVVRALPDGGSRVILGSDAQRPFAVALDDTHVYWTTSAGQLNFVRRMAKSGVGPVETVSDGPRNFFDLVVSKDTVVWTVREGTVGTLRTAPKSGGDAGLVAINQALPRGIATDGTRLFWVTTENNRLNQALFDGDAASFIEANGSPEEVAIAPDGQRVYWTSTTGLLNVYAAAIPLQGTYTTLASVKTPAYGIAVDDKYVYWATTNAVQRIAKDGSGSVVTLATLAPGQTGAREIAIDGENVYFTVAVEGLVLKTPK